MIKATIKGFNGTEFKKNKVLFLWVTWDRRNGKSINVVILPHETREAAKEEKYSRTEVEMMLGIKDRSFVVQTASLTGTGFDAIEASIHQAVIDQIKEKNYSHIVSLEVV